MLMLLQQIDFICRCFLCFCFFCCWCEAKLCSLLQSSFPGSTSRWHQLALGHGTRCQRRQGMFSRVILCLSFHQEVHFSTVTWNLSTTHSSWTAPSECYWITSSQRSSAESFTGWPMWAGSALEGGHDCHVGWVPDALPSIWLVRAEGVISPWRGPGLMPHSWAWQLLPGCPWTAVRHLSPQHTRNCSTGAAAASWAILRNMLQDRSRAEI